MKTNRLAFIKVYAFLFAAMLFVPLQSPAQRKNDKPGWTDYSVRKAKYPNNRFVSGFSSEEYRGDETRQEFLDRLTGAARSRLVESVVVEIKSMTTSNLITENTVTASYFKQTSVSMSSVQISGLTTETYFDEKEEIGYVFAYAKKTYINEHYVNQIDQLREQISGQAEKAEAARAAGNTREALENYYAALRTLQEAYQSQGVLMAMNRLAPDAPELQMDAIKTLKDKVDNGLKALQEGDMSLEGLSYFLAHGLGMQAQNWEKTTFLSAVTFEDTRTSSLFSKRLISQLERDLSSEGLRVTTNANLLNQSASQGQFYKLEGTYWEQGDELKVILVVRNPDNGETVASAEGNLPVSWLETNNIAYKPANYENIIKSLQAFEKDEFVGSGLDVKLSTNKGADNPIFTEGDTLKLYVKANKPCYLRFVYYLADGTKVLMLDNMYVDREKVNKIYQLPDLFLIAPPFGAEILQLNAQTEPFEPLTTTPYGSYQLIQDELNQILANVRGFTPINDQGGQDETRITLTTLER